MSKMSRQKGARGEREALKWFERHFEDCNDLQRNLAQSREGGADCLTIPGIALEVKRQEKLSVPEWWRQATQQAINTNRMPVLMYRLNRCRWKFCIPASLITPRSWGYVTLEENEFVKWYKTRWSSGFN